MATSEIPSIDRENVGTAHIKSKHKMANPKGLSNAGQSEQMSFQASKRFGDIKGGLDVSHRSFGDISNRVEQVCPENYNSGAKKTSHMKPKPAEVWESTADIGAEAEENFGFIPNIIETEDYDDIMPEECRLTRKDFSHLTDFWGTYQKSAPKLGSSPREIALLMKPVPFVYQVPKVEPIDDTIFMPPPPWE